MLARFISGFLKLELFVLVFAFLFLGTSYISNLEPINHAAQINKSSFINERNNLAQSSIFTKLAEFRSDLNNREVSQSAVKPQGQVAGATTIEIPANFDGDTRGAYDDGITATTVRAGGYMYRWRAYWRFPLDSLPTGATVTDVKLKVNVAELEQEPACAVCTWDFQGYDQNGQADPETDPPTGADSRRTRSGNDPTPYVDETTAVSTLGFHTLQFPSEANTELMAAKEAVNRFSIGAHHGVIRSEER